jgi:hypothetical protein
MEADFNAAYPNQETSLSSSSSSCSHVPPAFLAENFHNTGQIIIVSDISTASLDSITFLVITLSHIFTQVEAAPEPHTKPCAIILKGWPLTFLGMALDSGAELRFQVEDLA